MDEQWLCDHAIELARWQHPAVGCRTKYDMHGATFTVINFIRDHRDIVSQNHKQEVKVI